MSPGSLCNTPLIVLPCQAVTSNPHPLLAPAVGLERRLDQEVPHLGRPGGERRLELGEQPGARALAGGEELDVVVLGHDDLVAPSEDLIEELLVACLQFVGGARKRELPEPVVRVALPGLGDGERDEALLAAASHDVPVPGDGIEINREATALSDLSAIEQRLGGCDDERSHRFGRRCGHLVDDQVAEARIARAPARPCGRARRGDRCAR